MTELWGMKFYTSPYIARDQFVVIHNQRAVFLHPATTHALINRIPEREAHMTYNFWQALNPRLAKLEREARAAWLLEQGKREAA